MEIDPKFELGQLAEGGIVCLRDSAFASGIGIRGGVVNRTDQGWC